MVACAPTYAPPVRSLHGGAPRPSFDSILVDLGDSAVVVPGAAVRIPLSRRLATELGGDATGAWQMAHGGLRLTTPIGAAEDGNGAADVELGAGAAAAASMPAVEAGFEIGGARP